MSDCGCEEIDLDGICSSYADEISELKAAIKALLALYLDVMTHWAPEWNASEDEAVIEARRLLVGFA